MIQFAYCTYTPVTGWRVRLLKYGVDTKISVVLINNVKYLQIPTFDFYDKLKLRPGNFCNPRKIVGI